ncbi:GntR family transcriptional regulator [Actinomadura rupiterrae]|uniref:GntR family transcriptional regulator n=1 Tax=Actinomadura rupiterrae TaxID=559627 RepID=UPI0020A58CE8|nr:GntR family transcriptional regulator [Actinomadura rupiterrae]
MSSLEFEPPKYARVVLELRRRIEDGEYAPGAALPSESQLVREFAVGRTTVVRALELLKKDGWITREHGRGSFVRGRPVTREEASRPGLAVLDRPETARPVAVGLAKVSPGVAALMGVDRGEQMIRRRWVNMVEGIPSELVTCWFPPALAYGTDLDSDRPITAGIREHLRTVKDLRIDHIVEQLTARHPRPDEAELLDLKPTDAVLALTASARDAADASRFGIEVLLPGHLHELEDRYSVPN